MRLVTGPTALPIPDGVTGVKIETAVEMTGGNPAFLEQLVRARRWSIRDTRAALAGFRGESVPHFMRGDPTE